MLAFEDLVRRHQGAVCATAYAVLRDRARSEEVAQDAFLIAWRDLPGISPPPSLPAWICGIARNLARNARRKRKEIAMPPGADVASTETPLETLLDREASGIATRALAALAERDREVVVLYYRGDQSIAEVASALGITEPSARQRLHRGRERLKAAVAAVEATLRATRPGPAFTLACVAALAAGTATPATAATTASTKSPWLAAAIGGAVVATALAVIVGMRGSPQRPPEAQPRSAIGSPTGHARSAGGSSTGHARSLVVSRLGSAARGVMLERARAARDLRVAAGAAMEVKVYDFADSLLQDLPPVEPREPGVLSKQTLRYGITLIQPLLLDCYAPGPREATTFQIAMRLVGEPTSGTVVESVELQGDTNASRTACLRETLLDLEFPPMTEPGIWDVRYPFVVRPE